MNLRQLALLVIWTPVLWAGYGAENPRLEKLYGTFISPCCWQENLTVHDSPVAEQLRTQIQTLVREGRTDEQIKAALVHEHTKRVLALPEGTEGIWLFLTPWLLATAGLAMLVAVIQKLRRQRPAPAHSFAPADLGDDWEDQ